MHSRKILLFGLVLFLSGCARSHYYIDAGGGEVDVYVKEKEAREVLFFSSADHFQPHQAQKMSGGLWRVTMPDRKEIRYFYMIDGKKVLPDCRWREEDDFGSENCVYVRGM
jgi:hypothetical protein